MSPADTRERCRRCPELAIEGQAIARAARSARAPPHDAGSWSRDGGRRRVGDTAHEEGTHRKGSSGHLTKLGGGVFNLWP